MPWVKGQSGNPGGIQIKQKQALDLIQTLGLVAVKRWRDVLEGKTDCSNSEINQVAALVAAYAFGRPKQEVKLDATLEVNHRAHITALTTLANMVNGPEKTAKLLELQPESASGPKDNHSAPVLIDQSVSQPTELIDQSVSQPANAAARGDLPPGEGGGSPGGGPSTRQPLPLDDKT